MPKRDLEMITWRIALTMTMEEYGESINDIIHCTILDEELDRPFDGGYGSTEGAEFTAWTKNRVYFPATYDGSEWIASVPRNPCDESTPHVGG